MRSIYFIWALLARSYRGYKNFGNISTQTHIRRSTTLRQAGHLLCPPHYTALSPMHDDSSTALIDLEVLRGFQSYRGKCYSCHKTSSCISPLGTSLISEHPRLQHFLLHCLFLSSSSNFQTRSLLRDTALLPPSFPKAPHSQDGQLPSIVQVHAASKLGPLLSTCPIKTRSDYLFDLIRHNPGHLH